MITGKKQLFSHVYIKPVKDNTIGTEAREEGNMCGVGYLPYGNPLFPLSISSYDKELETTVENDGGSLKNKTTYHLSDYFTSAGTLAGSVQMARLIGSDSTTKVLAIEEATPTVFVQSDLKIFGVNSMDDWKDVVSTKPLEVISTDCFEEKVTVDVKFMKADEELTITIQDQYGNEVYKVAGAIDKASKNDYNKLNYIGILADKKHLLVKVDKASTIYGADFTITETFANGLMTDVGAYNVETVKAHLEVVVENCDYMATMDITDAVLIKAMKVIADNASISTVLDCTLKTAQEVIDFKNGLNISDMNLIVLWSRPDYLFDSGEQRIGLSGWFVGHRIAKNIGSRIGKAEDRINGIAFRDYPLPRKVIGLVKLDTDTLNELAKNRINTVVANRGLFIVSDFLSADPKETFMKSFAIADGENFLSRGVARLLEDQMGKNINLAKSTLERTIGRLFEDAQSLNYFDTEAPTPFTIKITDKEGDTIVVEYSYFPQGALRKGEVQPIVNALDIKIA